ncbi:hypothetical protein PHISCL_06248 [Aspergillus sclerotialis]|uniref:DUF6536 domain-containing protein n=1 Tax=Aspergillus sclerotialis TaxID=2070753 RepID=A0A3A2ZJ35_9EURO|nr:hypothetical protein PHISCL_06248 [Aspergillus sclerotialis]
MKVDISPLRSWAQSLSSTQRSRVSLSNDPHREETELLAISKDQPTASATRVTTESGAPEEQTPLKPTYDEAITSTQTDGNSAVPDLEDSNQPKIQQSTWIKGAYLCGYAAIGLLLLNVILVSVTVFYEGSCQTVSRSSTGLHVIINSIGTCTLAASNYSMQTLVALTRSAIDIYHAKRLYLHIGGTTL